MLISDQRDCMSPVCSCPTSLEDSMELKHDNTSVDDNRTGVYSEETVTIGHRHLYSLDALKVVASIFVVTIHMFAPVLTIEQPIGSTLWQWGNLFDSLAHVAVPLFVMVSGALMLDPSRNEGVREIWAKRISRFAIAFVVWSALYCIVKVFLGTIRTPVEILTLLLSGEFHLWYLIMISVLYALAPALKGLANSELCLYVALLCFALGCAESLPLLFIDGMAHEVVTSWAKDLSFSPGYLGYFLMGRYLLAGKRTRAVPLPVVLLLFAAGLTGTVLSLSSQSKNTGAFSGFFYEGCSPFMIVMSVALFDIAVRGEKNGLFQTLPSPLRSFLTLISRHSLGIYLIHYVFILLWREKLFAHSLRGLLIGCVVVYALSVCGAMVIKRLPIIGNRVS